jgi:ABC-2 type transport system permease protein
MIFGDGLTGLLRLTRLILRRDRVRIPIWVGSVTALIVISGASLRSTYDTPVAIHRYVEVAGDNPALVVFAGPGYGFDDPNIGVVLVNETLLWGAIAAALMSIFMVVRHTRAEEESERADLVRSSVVGRHAGLFAAIAIAVAMNLAVFVPTVVGLVAEGYAAPGSIALAASIAVVGIVFAGVTAVAAQFVDSARGALGWASAGLGGAFAIRAVGDVGGNWASWASPLGWALAVRAFAEERWWTLLLGAALTVALTAVALDLSTRRDLGSGLVTEHGGPSHAAPWIIRPAGLALRLQRAAIIGWTIGLLVTGLVFGAVGNDVGRLLEDNPDLTKYLEQFAGVSITDAYFTTAMQMMALLASGFALSSILRARTEEMAGRAEPIIATSTSRTAWWAGQLAITAAGTVLVTVAGGLGVGIAYGIVVGDAGQVPRLAVASLVTLPAVFVLVGVALALYGLMPRWVLVVWGVFAVVVVIGIFAETLRLPQWVRNLSPFEQLPDVPARGIAVVPLVALCAVAAALAVAGWRGFCRRDLAAA